MTNKVKKTERTSLGLRDTLFDELDALRDGSSTPQRAGAIAKLAVQIVNTVNLELDFQKYVANSPKSIPGGVSTTPLNLGG